MLYPKIKFKISLDKDIASFYSFVKDIPFDEGKFFEWAITEKHPFFNKFYEKDKRTCKVSREILGDYIKQIYEQQQNQIAKNLKIYRKNWVKVEKFFFQLVDELFNSREWPKGKYIAYTTIWGMYPRFIEDKTFQIPIKQRNKKYVNVVIAHELLHFMFYDYFLEKYPKYDKDKFNFFLWNISEIFNSIVQNSKKWVKAFEVEGLIYPEHKNIVNNLQKKYSGELPCLEDIIKDIMQYGSKFLGKK